MNAPASRGTAPVHVDFFLTRAARQDPRPAVAVRHHRFGSWVVLEIEGEMDIQLASAIDELSGRHWAFVVFDLHEVTFMDATGLRVMAEMQRQAVASGGCVRVAAPSRQARRLLELAGSDRALRVFDSVRQAVTTPLDRLDRPTRQTRAQTQVVSDRVPAG